MNLNHTSVEYRQFLIVASAFFTLALFTIVPASSAIAGTLNAGGGGGTGGSEFTAFYTWIQGAATGYLGRAIAIIGGITGLIIGALTARMLVAGMGIVLGIAGVVGPAIVDALFTTAII